MTRLGSLGLCVTLGSALLACGSNSTGNGGTGGNSGNTGGNTTAGGGKSGGAGGNTAGGGGSSSSSKNPVDLAPIDNTVSGWTVDRSANKDHPGSLDPMTATTKEGASNVEDGAGSLFWEIPNDTAPAYTPKVFLVQYYVNSSLASAPPAEGGATVKLYILEMPSADQASGLYTGLLPKSRYSRKAWDPTTPLLGTESRIQDTNTDWFINFYKGVFYVEVLLTPSTGPQPDYTPGNAETKQEAIRFAQAIANKI